MSKFDVSTYEVVEMNQGDSKIINGGSIFHSIIYLAEKCAIGIVTNMDQIKETLNEVGEFIMDGCHAYNDAIQARIVGRGR